MTPSTAYDLLNRYLQAVGKHLWPSNGEDVLAELASNLEAELAEQESALGRSLDPAEVAAVLKRHGHPMEVAGRYLPRQYLIGPGWLPVYWYVLKIVLAIAWVVYAVVNAVAVTTMQRWSMGAVAGVLVGSWGVLFQAFAWVTLVFAGLEWAGARCATGGKKGGWDPLKLPKLERTGRRRLGWGAACELLPGIFWLAYWVVIPSHPILVFGPAAAFLDFTPGLERMFWPVLMLALAELALDIAALGYGANTWQRRAKGAASKAVALGIFGLLLKAGEWVVAIPAAEPAAAVINHGIQIGLQISITVLMFMLVWDTARLLQHAKRRRRRDGRAAV
jgi:hypothetical protein